MGKRLWISGINRGSFGRMTSASRSSTRRNVTGLRRSRSRQISRRKNPAGKIGNFTLISVAIVGVIAFYIAMIFHIRATWNREADLESEGFQSLGGIAGTPQWYTKTTPEGHLVKGLWNEGEGTSFPCPGVKGFKLDQQLGYIKQVYNDGGQHVLVQERRSTPILWRLECERLKNSLE